MWQKIECFESGLRVFTAFTAQLFKTENEDLLFWSSRTYRSRWAPKVWKYLTDPLLLKRRSSLRFLRRMLSSFLKRWSRKSRVLGRLVREEAMTSLASQKLLFFIETTITSDNSISFSAEQKKHLFQSQTNSHNAALSRTLTYSLNAELIAECWS